MSEMIERVAMTLFAADGMKHAASNISLEQSWGMSLAYHDAYRIKARLAIEAMSKPTEQMAAVVYGGSYCHEADDVGLMMGADDARTLFSDMMREALK